MSDNQQPITVNSSFISFPQLLTVIFIVLKVLHKIAWSWWLVFAPLWIGFLLFVGFMLIVGLTFLGVYLHDLRSRKRRQASRNKTIDLKF